MHARHQLPSDSGTAPADSELGQPNGHSNDAISPVKRMAAQHIKPAPRRHRSGSQLSPFTVLVLVAVLCYGGYVAVRVRTMHQRVHQLESHSTVQIGQTAGAGDSPSTSSSPQLQPEPAQSAVPRTLRFQVCNGFANQRLGILYAVLIAKKTQRGLVLPRLVSVGTQYSLWNVLADDSSSAPFDTVYDSQVFKAAMAKFGVPVVSDEEAPPPSVYRTLKLSPIGFTSIPLLVGSYGKDSHLAIGCPLFKLWPGAISQEETPLMWAVLDSLVPNPAIAKMVAAGVQALGAIAAELRAQPSERRLGEQEAVGLSLEDKGLVSAQQLLGDDEADGEGERQQAAWEGDLLHAELGRQAAAGAAQALAQAGADHTAHPVVEGAGGRFNVLHLRMENDWVAHCGRWEQLHDGIVRNNCYNNTDTIHDYLRLVGFHPDVPLYVATFWQDIDPERNRTVLAALAEAGYRLVTSQELLPEQAGSMQREQLALVEYFIGLSAHKFVGNSVSTFSALAMLERRHRGKWAGYYNTGNIPITALLPALHPMPWVFTYNSWSEPYDYMLKAAVRSANRVGGLKPYCMFIGDTNSTIYAWLAAQNVTMIHHQPLWREQLVLKANASMQSNVVHSHLYKSQDRLVSTFQRIDVAVMPVLNQYTYVLYTDADVYFRRTVTLDDFGLPLPEAVGMSYEMRPEFPYNAGVMLMHLPHLRKTYRDFLHFIFSNKAGLFFGSYGPADQGAFNQFYEADVRRRMVDQKFNSKPYNEGNNAAIVHFHGPKPHEFLNYAMQGKCDFYWMCEQGFLKSLCSYAHEWVQYVDRSYQGAADLIGVCRYLAQNKPDGQWGPGDAPADKPPTSTMQSLHGKLRSSTGAAARANTDSQAQQAVLKDLVHRGLSKGQAQHQ